MQPCTKPSDVQKVVLARGHWVLDKKLQLMLKGNKKSALPLFCPILSGLLYKQNVAGGLAGEGEVPMQSHDSWRTERVHLIA